MNATKVGVRIALFFFHRQGKDFFFPPGCPHIHYAEGCSFSICLAHISNFLNEYSK